MCSATTHNNPGALAAEPGEAYADPGALAADPGALAADPGALAAEAGAIAAEAGAQAAEAALMAMVHSRAHISLATSTKASLVLEIIGGDHPEMPTPTKSRQEAAKFLAQVVGHDSATFVMNEGVILPAAALSLPT